MNTAREKAVQRIAMLRPLVYLGLWLWPLCTLAQIQHEAAEVSSEPWLKAGYFKTDSLDHIGRRGATLGSLLSDQGWNLLATGASGQSEQLRVGGYSADHVAVFWHGLDVNSLTLGSADLSLLPAFLFPRATFSTLPEAGFAPSSAMAGALQLTPAGHKPSVEAEYSVNSLVNQTIGLRVPHQLGEGRGSTTVHYTHANNRFRYTDTFLPDPTELTQERNDQRMLHLMHGWTADTGNNRLLEANAWAFGRSVEVPKTEGNLGSPYGLQTEAALRASVRWRKLGPQGWLVEAAHAEEWFEYTYHPCDTCDAEPFPALPSQRTVLRAWRQWTAEDADHQLSAAIRTVRQAIHSENHGRVIEWLPQVQATYHWEPAGLSFEVQQLIVSRTLPQLTLTYRQTVKRIPGHFRVQLGHRSRLPDFNERYWQPGGNPDLLPESGYTAGIAWITERTHWRIMLSGDLRQLEDAIAWVYNADPGYWEPVNRSRAQHLSTGIHARWSKGRLALKARGAWQFARMQPTEDQPWETAPYVPAFTFGGKAVFTKEDWRVFVAANGQSERTTGTDWQPPLEGFVLTDIGIARRMGSHLNLEFQINNLLNTSYRLVYGHPVPGRAFQINLLWQ